MSEDFPVFSRFLVILIINLVVSGFVLLAKNKLNNKGLIFGFHHIYGIQVGMFCLHVSGTLFNFFILFLSSGMVAL